MPFFAVCQPYFDLLLAFAWRFAAFLARAGRVDDDADARLFTADGTRLRLGLFTFTWRHPAFLALLGDGISVPLGIEEVVICIDKVVDREIFLAIKKPRAASNDLFEFDHRINRTHQDDVSHISGVNAGR